MLADLKHVAADVLFIGQKKESLYVLSANEAYVEKTGQNTSALLWHARLGHVGYQLLQEISTKKLIHGVPHLKEFHQGVVCSGCQYGKSHRLPFERSKNRASTSFELIHSDLMGPTRTPSYCNFQYMMVIVDDYSRYTWVFFLQHKSDAFSKFVQFKMTVEKEFGSKIKCLRTDNGGEFLSDEFQNYCSKEGIRRQMTCPRTPQQNGVAERKLGHLAATSLSWLHEKNLPRELWAEAFSCASHVINRLPPWPGSEKSPFEALYNLKPDVRYFRVFGSPCYVHVPKDVRTKLDPKAKKCVFVGYDPQRKGWRCMDPKTNKVVVSRDVVFDEASTYYSVGSSNHNIISSDFFPTEVSATEECRDESLSVENVQQDVEPLRRSTRQKRQPDYLNDYEVQVNDCTVTSCFFMGATYEDEPKCYAEAQGISKWEEAMREEIDALRKNNTWELVPKPKGAELVTCKWVYKLKTKADGTIERHKARLVARGFSQQYGLDYEETFSPVAKMVTVRTVVSLAAYKGWNLWQLDVKNAFLYGELDRDIFMEQPQGFVSKEFPNHACRLKKALYGLKQAPRAWYGKIAQYLTFCGFKTSSSDPSLFIKTHSAKYTMILLYVDDMIITGDDNAEITRLRNDLSVRFEMKNLGEAQCFLGLEVKKSDGYFLSQRRYATSLINRFGMSDSKVMATPMEPCVKLQKVEGKPLEDVKKFRQLVGSLFYLTITRPDIAYSVGVVSQFMDKPCVGHLIAAKRILRYVKGSLGFGLMYRQNMQFSLCGFVDADWAGDINDRRSTTGYCFNTGSAVVSWCSKKQRTIALSSTEAEYMAATMATQECIWLKRLIQDVTTKMEFPIPIHCDNESAIKLAGNPIFHARTKHIEVHYHFVREKVLNEEIKLQKVSSKDQVADIFTKALAKTLFEKFRTDLGIVDQEHALRGSVKY